MKLDFMGFQHQTHKNVGLFNLNAANFVLTAL
jgi:hypothetical protein